MSVSSVCSTLYLTENFSLSFPHFAPKKRLSRQPPPTKVTIVRLYLILLQKVTWQASKPEKGLVHIWTLMSCCRCQLTLSIQSQPAAQCSLHHGYLFSDWINIYILKWMTFREFRGFALSLSLSLAQALALVSPPPSATQTLCVPGCHNTFTLPPPPLACHYYLALCGLMAKCIY